MSRIVTSWRSRRAPHYAWVVLGIFYVGTPYVLRNQIDWLQKSGLRWQVATWTGLLYGVAVLCVAFTLLPA